VTRIPPRTLAAAALVLAAAPALAWTPQTRVRMIDDAVRLMPASLRQALGSYREPLLAGMLGPLEREDDAAHRPPSSGGALDASVERVAGELATVLAQPTDFASVAERFGQLAHFVADAGFPPGAVEAGERYAHFASFCESRRERFPLVFYGHSDALLGDLDWRTMAREILARASAEDRTLAEAYAAAGTPPDPAAFDDRSVPFAVGSLAYSYTVTDIVRSWLAAWRDAGGDLGRTPYLTRPRLTDPGQ
jgi:hypothetical protein